MGSILAERDNLKASLYLATKALEEVANYQLHLTESHLRAYETIKAQVRVVLIEIKGRR